LCGKCGKRAAAQSGVADGFPSALNLVNRLAGVFHDRAYFNTSVRRWWAGYCLGMRDHVEFLRSGYEALQQGDLEAFKALARERLGPDFEFHLVWDGRVLKGYTGTLEWLEDTRETWEEYSQEVEEIIDLGAQVIVVLRISARGAGSGVPVAQELAVVWTFDGERAVRARSFTSRAAALAGVRQAQ
jgi:ketosteroid isomerase-like protein